MTCDKVKSQLTAYLDGELADDRGSAVRGHLRGCADCRQTATTEAALRDGLRELPSVDPPASMWAGVQARLAAEEVADSERPAWRRAIGRWMPKAPQLALGSAVLAAAVVLVVIRAKRNDDQPQPTVSTPTKIAPVVVAPYGTQPTPPVTGDDNRDVSDVLANAPAQVSEEHAVVVRELLPLAQEARSRWAESQRQAFDTRLVELQREVSNATSERVRQRHYRALIRYLQRAAIRDDVALASTGGPQ